MRHKIFNTDLITSEAMQIFWSKGYNQTSIQDLMNINGFNRAALYESYGDKEALFKACFIKYRKEVVSQFNLIFNSDSNSKTSFVSFFEFITNSYFDDSKRRGCLICNTFVEFLPSVNHSMSKLLNETKEMITEIICKKLKEADKKNELNQEVNHRKLSCTIYSSIVGVAVLSKTNMKRNDVSGVFDTYLNIFK